MSEPCTHALRRRCIDPANHLRSFWACDCGKRIGASRVGLHADGRHVQELDPRRDPYRRAKRVIEREAA